MNDKMSEGKKDSNLDCTCFVPFANLLRKEKLFFEEEIIIEEKETILKIEKKDRRGRLEKVVEKAEEEEDEKTVASAAEIKDEIMDVEDVDSKLNEKENLCKNTNLKNILICFDGSGNSPEKNFPDEEANIGLTNILKFHLLAGGSIDETDDSCHVDGQVSLYQRGVEVESVENGQRSILDYASAGTGIFSNLVGLVTRRVEEAEYYIGSVKEGQVLAMLTRFRKVYKDGDSVHVIGFGRGAAAARLFAAEVLEKNLVPSIEILGCFDTVFDEFSKNMLNRNTAGFPPSTFLNEKDEQLNPQIKKAIHCVSMDDLRFKPKIMKNLSTIGALAPTLMGNSNVITEVWFPGKHSNVGGGYFNHELSDIPFEFMKEWLESTGFSFLNPCDVTDKAFQNTSDGYVEKFSQNIPKLRESLASNPNAMGELGSKWGYGWNSFRLIDVLNKGQSNIDTTPVKIHQSILERAQNSEQYIVNPNLLRLARSMSKSVQRKIQVATTMNEISESMTEAAYKIF